MSDPLTHKSFAKGRPVVAYIKPSDYCNVGCEHCYLPLEVRSQKFRMSKDILHHSLNTVSNMVKSQNAPGALIVWHGGEPLALPKTYFAEICAETRKYLPTAFQTLQTSLIPYTSSWAPLIQEFFEGHIGSSIDFTQRAIRNNPSAYQDLWMKKTELARADGFYVLPGMVPSRSEVGKEAEIVEWFHTNGFDAWNIDRYNSFAKSDPARPSNREHSRFLSSIFDEVMGRFVREGQFIKVNTVQAAIGGILKNASGDRWGGSCSHDFIVINPDGSTNACPDKMSFETFSNVREGFEGFKLSEERKKWIRKHLLAHQNSHCHSCKFNSFCKTGCPLTPNTPDTEGECSGYRRHLQHVQDWCLRHPAAAEDYLEKASK